MKTQNLPRRITQRPFSKIQKWTIVNKVDRKREKIKQDFQIEHEIKGYWQNEGV